MATHTIGTGGDFTTLQAWEDDLPATLTEDRIGQVLNEELVSASTLIVFSAHDATGGFFIILEAASSASFRDHANVRTNPLRYDASKGASIRCTGNVVVFDADGLTGSSDFPVIIRNLQIKHDSSHAYARVWSGSGGGGAPFVRFQNCIIEAFTSTFILYSGGGGYVRGYNCLIVSRGNVDKLMFRNSGGSPGEFVGCTFVRPSNLSAAGTAIHSVYASGISLSNCILLGFSTDAFNVSPGDYCATDKSDAASGLPDSPDHNVYDLVNNTSLFEQSSDAGGGHDFRVKSGSGVENLGIYDGTNSPSDISGFTRANPPEIGAWELGSAAPSRVGSLLALFQ